MTGPYQRHIYSAPVSMYVTAPTFTEIPSPFQGGEVQAALVTGRISSSTNVWIKGDMLQGEAMPSLSQNFVIDGQLITGALTVTQPLVWFPVGKYIGVQATGSGIANLVFIFRNLQTIYPRVPQQEAAAPVPHHLAEAKEGIAVGIPNIPPAAPDYPKPLRPASLGELVRGMF